MSGFVERLIVEETELNEKKAKLASFIKSDRFLSIDKEQRSFLSIQHAAMATYSECLNQRIIHLNNKEIVGENTTAH